MATPTLDATHGRGAWSMVPLGPSCAGSFSCCFQLRKYVIQMDFEKGKASNNVAEYEGFLCGLRAAAGLGIHRLVVRGDSQLVVNQVSKDYDCPRMKAYVEEVRKLELQFKGIHMEHIPRGGGVISSRMNYRR